MKIHHFKSNKSMSSLLLQKLLKTSETKEYQLVIENRIDDAFNWFQFVTQRRSNSKEFEETHSPEDTDQVSKSRSFANFI